MKSIAYIFLVLILTACNSEKSDADPLLATVKKFYGWVLVNSQATQQLAPKIVDEPNSTRFKLESNNLKSFTEKMLSSGVFASSFPSKVEKYYAQHQANFAKLPQKEFDEMAKFGRGPMMEVEDMDMFFCAQEYEKKPEFVEKLAIKKYNLKGNTAWAVIESPYGWPTTFYFEKINQQWLISGYCVFE